MLLYHRLLDFVLDWSGVSLLKEQYMSSIVEGIRDVYR
jgi:hypothetical protein